MPTFPSALAAAQVLLRDYRNGEQHPIDPPLFDYLYDVARRLGVDPVFSVISGYRSPQTNERLRERSSGVARHSLHLEGRAIDVRLEGVDCADLAAGALGLEPRRRGLLPQIRFRALGHRRVPHLARLGPTRGTRGCARVPHRERREYARLPGRSAAHVAEIGGERAAGEAQIAPADDAFVPQEGQRVVAQACAWPRACRLRIDSANPKKSRIDGGPTRPDRTA